MGTSASGNSLTNKDRFPYFTRVIPSDALQGRAMATVIKSYGWTEVIALYSTDTYGAGGIQEFAHQCNVLGKKHTFTPSHKWMNNVLFGNRYYNRYINWL
jgi:ABC-type branched-subunit amino acid transport system substrate-binding protein